MMDDLDKKTSTKKYMSYSKMSISMTLYGLFVLVFLIIKKDMPPMFELFSVIFSILHFVFFLLSSLFFVV